MTHVTRTTPPLVPRLDPSAIHAAGRLLHHGCDDITFGQLKRKSERSRFVRRGSRGESIRRGGSARQNTYKNGRYETP